MSFNLVASLRTVDHGFSSGMRAAMRSTQSLRNAVDQTTRSTSSFRRIGSNFNPVTSSISGVTKGFVALGAAIAGAKLASDGLKSTLGAALDREMQTAQITAMFKGDKKSAQQAIDVMTKQGIDSNLYGGKDFMDNATTFLSMTKSPKQLKEILSLSERLAASAPGKTIEDAAFSLRELQSSDATSIIERFNIPRKIANDMKKMPIDKQLKSLDQYLSKVGFGDNFLKDIGNTSQAKLNRMKEQISNFALQTGQVLLTKLAPAIDVVSKWFDNGGLQKVSTFMSDIGTQIKTNLAPSIQFAKSVFEEFKPALSGIAANLPAIIDGFLAFQKTIYSTVMSVIVPLVPIIGQIFQSVWEVVGPILAPFWRMLVSIGKTVEAIVKNVVAPLLPVIGVAFQIMWNQVEPILSTFSSLLGTLFDIASATFDKITSLVNKISTFRMPSWVSDVGSKIGSALGVGKSHASGLSHVPYNGWLKIAA